MSKLGNEIFRARHALAEEKRNHESTQQDLIFAVSQIERFQDEKALLENDFAIINMDNIELQQDRLMRFKTRGYMASTIVLAFSIGVGAALITESDLKTGEYEVGNPSQTHIYVEPHNRPSQIYNPFTVAALGALSLLGFAATRYAGRKEESQLKHKYEDAVEYQQTTQIAADHIEAYQMNEAHDAFQLALPFIKMVGPK